jgi:hypothetical protein
VDTADLAELFATDGPFASVYLDASSTAVPDAGAQLDLRWRNVRRDLEQAGAPEVLLDVVEGAVGGDHEGGDTLAIVAAGDRVLLRAHLPEPPKHDVGLFGALPAVGPLLEWEQGLLPHVVVTADRVGADIVAIGRSDVLEERQVRGETEHITRSHPGGWSQRRFQQRAENTWEQNAKQVADEVTEVVDAVGARLLLVSGDVRAVGFLRQHLPGRLEGITKVIEHGGTTVESSIGALTDDVVRQVATVAAEDTVALLQEFREERGQHDRAADGVAPTVTALQMAQVATLLLAPDVDDDRTAWYGPEPGLVALTRGELEGFGVEAPVEGRLEDVLLRAAAGTGAAVRIVPAATVTDGVGAILRRGPSAPAPSAD